METKKLVELLFNELSRQIQRFSNEDLAKLESGAFELLVKLQKKKNAPSGSTETSQEHMRELARKLQICRSREEGLSILTAELKTKAKLESFARHLDVLVSKQDKVENIRDKVVEATVGAILRSAAIQGKKASNSNH